MAAASIIRHVARNCLQEWKSTMVSNPTLPTGARVRIVAPHFLLTLRSRLGTIVRRDEYLDYYIVRLDEPVAYREPDGRTTDLAEIRESAANLEVVAASPAPTNVAT